MPRWVAWTLGVAVLAAAGFALLRWPWLNEVETGRTPQYPDLQVREYALPEARVLDAAKATIESLPGWTFIGAGSGPGGGHLRAQARARALALTSEVAITVRREGGRTKVSVRSRSGPKFDLGRNAAHVREFLSALDARLAAPRPPR